MIPEEMNNERMIECENAMYRRVGVYMGKCVAT
jgi:hypothetical protein